VETCDVAVVGAGPFGLSVAAHLRGIRGLETRVFGEPMSFWDRHMPSQMRLRSRWTANHLSDPARRLSLDAFGALPENRDLQDPLPVAEFIKYGHWFRQQAGIHADGRKVVRIDFAAGVSGYAVALEDGEELQARRVIVAAGIQLFAHRPDRFRGLPQDLVSHSCDPCDFARLRDKSVLVIGGGQSALEAGAFLHQAGARAEILVRQPESCGRPNVLKRWLAGKEGLQRKLYGRGDVGPAGISLIIQHPNLFRRFPRQKQDLWTRKAMLLGFSYRLVPPCDGLQVTRGVEISEVSEHAARLRLRLSDGTTREADHIILATGYRVDVRAYPFLSPAVRDRLNLVQGYPRLDAGFESSAPGLHFLGAPAGWSFGPLVRFVAGADFAARSVAQRIKRARQPRPSFTMKTTRKEPARAALQSVAPADSEPSL
jgi:FAD-dependent urate hydroxylase